MAAGDVVINLDYVLGKGAGGDIRVMGGTVTLDGGNPTPIALAGYLASIQMAVVSMEGAGAPGADPNSSSSMVSQSSIVSFLFLSDIFRCFP